MIAAQTYTLSMWKRSKSRSPTQYRHLLSLGRKDGTKHTTSSRKSRSSRSLNWRFDHQSQCPEQKFLQSQKMCPLRSPIHKSRPCGQLCCNSSQISVTSPHRRRRRRSHSKSKNGEAILSSPTRKSNVCATKKLTSLLSSWMYRKHALKLPPTPTVD